MSTATVSIQREGAKVRIHICEDANTYFKNNSSKILPVFARVRIQAPHVFAQKLIPKEIYPACIGFVPGGISELHSRVSVAMPTDSGSEKENLKMHLKLCLK